jgi:hypothetical protein
VGILTGPQYQQLSEALVDAFSDEGRLRQMLRFRCDISLNAIVGPGPLVQRSFDLIEVAEAEEWTQQLVVGARASNPRNALLAQVAEQLGLAVKAPDERQLEVLINESQGFVNPTTWREKLGALEAQVCHIEFPYRGQMVTGTGCLVGPDIVLTNHHVVALIGTPDVEPGTVTATFDFRLTKDGKQPGTPYRLADHWLLASSPASQVDRMRDPGALEPKPTELDFALIRLADSPGSKAVGANPEPEALKRGWVTELAPAIETNGILLILQHPDGEPIQMAIDTVTYVNSNRTRVRYRTNTLPGSSGSPCFDVNWRLMALHHSGDPKADEIRKGTYNEGIPIDAVLGQLSADLRKQVFREPGG